MVNNLTIVGNLVKDVEVQKVGEMSILKNTVAVRRDRKEKDGTYASDFINIVAFGHSADFLGNYAKKGNMVSVVGRIQTGSYENKEGNKVYTTDVVANNVYILTQKEGEGQAPQSKPVAKTEAVSDDLMPF